MRLPIHNTTRASYYDTKAQYYDKLNENDSEVINCTIEKALKKYGVLTVLDLTCGTGSQVFWLLEAGFEVVGSDISTSMLQIAKQKAKDRKLEVNFLQGDMRDFKVGEFDAVITISNSIGHLTRQDFRRAVQNVNRNLKAGGIYIFDIFNLTYLKYKDNITKFTLDELAISENRSSIREVQFSYITHEGVLASYNIYFEQEGENEPVKISRHDDTLQCYNTDELKTILEESDFKILEQIGIDGSQFSENETERILTIAKKV
jgi:ubiquinone/menaquinone biosynthesis C-methylase UbiE